MVLQLGLWDDLGGNPRDERGVVLAIRESRRARRLILQALPPRTVEVVVPRGVRTETVRRFISENRVWIDRAGAELVAAYPAPDLKPDAIELAALGKRVTVCYRDASSARSSYRQCGDRLTLHCAGGQDGEHGPLLRRWLLDRGRQLLKPWLAREALRTKLEPSRIQIRLQKSRWGSCSATGSISLNAALLFVPPDLVRYLMVHELCHLRYLNHSRRYWDAVARFEPDFRQLDRRLAACWRELPAWVFELANGSRPC